MSRRRKKKSASWRKREKFHFSQLSQTQCLVIAIILITIAIILILGLFELAGVAGEFLALGLEILFGWASWAVPVILIIAGLLCLGYKRVEERTKRPMGVRYLGLVLLLLAIAGAFHIHFVDSKIALQLYQGGGYIGYGLSFIIVKTFGFWASWVIFSCVFIIGLIIAFTGIARRVKEEAEKKETKILTRESSVQRGWREIKSVLAGKKELVLRPETRKSQLLEKTEEGVGLVKKHGLPKPAVYYKSSGQKIDMPLDLLESSSTKPNSGDIKANKLIIQKTLENFSIPVSMGEIKVGPTVTQYTLKPADGVKISQITTLHNDLAMALAAHPIRIEAPIPGQSLVGIEVPNQRVAVVRLKEILESQTFKSRKSNLTIALGKDVAGSVWLANLGKMPHLLVAGATGSGKTVMLNSIIVNLIYQNSPDDLKFILVDPKRVELTFYNDLPHLLTPVVTGVRETINALKWAISEMDRRFDVMSQAKKRDITAYNRDSKDKLPFIIIVIDELADLMVAAPQEVETCIIRLAQMARATGIHLVMATQRPSVDTITGSIKANIAARIAFAVTSMIDSRTILDFSGAEKLLGRGDMLFISSELSKPKRLQGAYVSDTEIKRIVEYLRNITKPNYQEGITNYQATQSPEELGALKEDEMLPQAREVVIRAGRGSASLLQRRLRVGYARAARLLDLLEEEGTIGPADGAKPREVYKDRDEDGDEEID